MKNIQKVKVFRFEKDATAFSIESEIEHWQNINNANIVDVKCIAPSSFDRYLIYNIVYQINN